MKNRTLNSLAIFLLHSLWGAAKWLTPRLVVVFAIGFGVVWGGLFHEKFHLIRGTASWAVIWMAVDYYRWHLSRYEA